jgi:hypothetical protein
MKNLHISIQVQVSSQQSKRILKILHSYLACNKIWLNLCVDHHHFGYKTQLTPPPQKRKEKNENKTLLHEATHHGQAEPAPVLLATLHLLKSGLLVVAMFSPKINVTFKRKIRTQKP